jgi:hypothetical protein
MGVVTTLSPARAVVVSTLCGVLGGGCAALAVRLLLPPAAQDGSAATPKTGSPVPTRPPEPTTSAPILTPAPDAVERAALATRAKLEAHDARLARLEVLRDRLEAAGLLEEPPNSPAEAPQPLPVAKDTPSQTLRKQYERLAAELGLKAERAKAFVDVMTDTTQRMTEMERAHARKTVDGDVTTVTIEGHAADAQRLSTELEAWVGRNLEADERERIVETGEYGTLLHRLGSRPRVITVRVADGEVKLTDQVREGPGGRSASMSIEIGGPAGLKDLLLADYAHLLR